MTHFRTRSPEVEKTSANHFNTRPNCAAAESSNAVRVELFLVPGPIMDVCTMWVD